jgi:hypothetical protein
MSPLRDRGLRGVLARIACLEPADVERVLDALAPAERVTVMDRLADLRGSTVASPELATPRSRSSIGDAGLTEAMLERVLAAAAGEVPPGMTEHGGRALAEAAAALWPAIAWRRESGTPQPSEPVAKRPRLLFGGRA